MPESPPLYVYRDNVQATRGGARNLLGHCWAWYCEEAPDGDAVLQQAPGRVFELVCLARHHMPDYAAMPPVTGSSGGRMEIDVDVPQGNPFGLDPPSALACWDAADGHGYTASFVAIPRLADVQVYPPT